MSNIMLHPAFDALATLESLAMGTYATERAKDPEGVDSETDWALDWLRAYTTALREGKAVTGADWKYVARYLAAMLALVPAQYRIRPSEDDLSLADTILEQYP